jgi:hypothetical protein
MRDVNVVQKQVGTILSDCINTFFLRFFCNFLWSQFGSLIVTLCKVSYNLNTFYYMCLVCYLVNVFNQVSKIIKSYIKYVYMQFNSLKMFIKLYCLMMALGVETCSAL